MKQTGTITVYGSGQAPHRVTRDLWQSISSGGRTGTSVIACHLRANPELYFCQICNICLTLRPQLAPLVVHLTLIHTATCATGGKLCKNAKDISHSQK